MLSASMYGKIMQATCPCEENAAGQSGKRGPTLDTAKRAVLFQRYYHLFDEGELDALVARVPGTEILDSFWDKNNWCVIFEACRGVLT